MIPADPRLMVFDAAPGKGVAYALPPEKIVADAPMFRSWDLETAADGCVVAGIWEATPGAWRSAKGDDWEFCHLMSGIVELTEDGGPTLTLRAGDSFVLRPGFVGVWNVIATVRKSFVIHSPAKA